MKFNKINLQILDRIGIQKLAYQKASVPLFQSSFSNEKNNIFQSRNVILSGEFFPLSEIFLRENLLEQEANVQTEITPKTEILICGKFPDWTLVEEAKLYGIKIIFIDHEGESFSKIASRLYKSRKSLHSYEEPLGV